MRTRVIGALWLGVVLSAGVSVGLVTRALGAQGGGAAVGAVHDPYAQSTQDYEAAKAKAKGGAVYTPLTVPDWTGIWRRKGDPEAMNAKDIAAALVPKYRVAYEEKLAKKARGVEWDRLSWCLPMGMPRWLADPWLREYIVTPKQTWMLYEQLEEERRIYTDGRGHVSDSVAIPLWEGDSIGFWDGDTLVIHTTHMKAGDYWRGSPDFSFQASSIERMRRVDANTMEDQLTVYDPVSLTRPVHLTYTYRRIDDPNVRIDYDSCEEGNTNFRTAEGGTGTRLPGEPEYREPMNFGIPEVAIDSRL